MKIEHHPVSKLFPILAYEPEQKLFIAADNSLCFGFLCRPLSGCDAAAGQRLNVFLNQEWPVDTLIQVSLYTSPDIDDTLALLETRRRNQKSYAHQQMTQETLAFLRNGTHTPLSGTDIVIRRVKLLVTVKLPLSNLEPTESDFRQAVELRQATEQALQTIGLVPQALSSDLYVRFMNTVMNWSPEAGWHDRVEPECDPQLLIREQFFDYDTSLRKDNRGLWLGDKRVKMLSVKRFPDQMNFGKAAAYLSDIPTGTRGIRENFMLSVTIHYPDAESTKSGIETRRQWVANQTHGPLLKFLPQLAERTAHFDSLIRAYNTGDRPVRIYFGMILFCDADNESRPVSNAKTYFRELGFQLMEDRFFCLPFFLNCLPFGAERAAMKDLNRYRTMATQHVIPLLPIFADWSGTGTPTINTISRNGQLQSISLFDSGSNYNCVIAAEPGRGKSFLSNEMILSYLAEGARIWVIDVGRSYKNLAEHLDGEFLEFSTESAICMNPFELIRDWKDEADIVYGLVSAMAAPTEKLSDLQTAGLKRVLKETWDQKGTTMCLDDLAEALKNDPDQRIRDVGQQLYPFTSKGEYGRFFNGRNNVRFTNDFVVLELEELKGRKHLQHVVLLQLIYQIQQEMYLGERDRPKLVIIDESWDLLGMGDTAKFMEEGARRFRKYGGASVFIVHSINDLYESPNGMAIAATSAFTFLLGQKRETIESVKEQKRLSLSEGGYALLSSVHTIPGRYSEILFLTSSGQGIGRLIVDPAKRLLYSTHPQDVHRLKHLREQGLDLHQAIQYVLAERSGRANHAA
jgi:conjugal transfer ATP-binding protein TraC